ncbi:MAG: PD-(D/E)XK nuclease family protein, partial [Psychrobium sp.]|nr:PD-(D/E)XK nuclease family protein [Psychrobium sp.]
TLDTNYRSSNDMVAAVNALWAQNEAPFIYQQDITFQAVKASNKTQYFSINDQRQGAVSQWIIPTDDAIGSQVYKNAMALACATQVNQLLSDGQLGLANIISIESSAGQEEIEYARGIVASDIAILVRDGSEAHLVKRELAKQGVSSVYLSNRHSVFSATIVSDVWRLMLAILEPTNARLLRSAMACQMMGLSALDLDELNQDERCWQRQVDLFTHWQQRWDKVGILAMLREVIHEQKIAKRLLQLIDGERQLTDLLHLGEILQQQSLETLSEHALAHWLAEKIHDSGQDNLEAQLRLESDRNLVQIVTIHKSKGLEYNLVFLPFICSFKKAKQGVYHQDGQTIVDLSGSSDALKKADKERLAEDLRLIYVALTRAVHHLWLGFAPLKLSKASKDKKTDLHHSAIGYLLLGNQVSTVDDLSRKLSALASEYAFINSQELPLASLAPYRALNDNQQAPQARKFSQTIENNYWITSYSALSKTSHHGGKKDLDASTELTAVDWQSELESIDKDSMLNEAQEALSIFNFPRGAHAGVFLHTLFEEIDFVHAHGDSLRDKVSELLEASEFDEKWLDVLLKLVSDVLDCSLNDGFSLRQLAMKDKQVEMEFFMPLSKFSCDDVNDILTTHDPLSKQAKPLQFMQVQGMLKGFIDLVFVKDNKYYILDYKSNHLGDQCTDYGVDQLSEVMIGHRYDFQYQLYSLALHRLLRSRITDYDYETHFGGVYYLFLRGMEQGQEHNHGIFYNRPSQLLVQELDQLFSEGASK